MPSFSRQVVASDEERAATNLNYNQEDEPQPDGEEEQVNFVKKMLGWLSFSWSAVIGIAGYLQYKKSRIAKDLLHISIVLMSSGFILASILYILAHKIHGRESFAKRLTYGAVFITMLVTMAVIFVVVASFY